LKSWKPVADIDQIYIIRLMTEIAG